MHPVEYREAAMESFQLDVDSVVFAATSLRAFKMLPKITITRNATIRSSENLKLCHELRQRLPQRADRRKHNFFEFRFGGYGDQTIRVVFQYVAPEGDGKFFTPPAVSGRYFCFHLMLILYSHFTGLR